MAMLQGGLLNMTGQYSPVSRALGVASKLQGLDVNRQEMSQQATLFDQQQAAQAEKSAARNQAVELLTTGTPDQIAEFGTKNPEIMKDFIQAAQFKDNEAVTSRVRYARDVLGGQVSPRVALAERIQSVEASGGDATGLKETLKLDDEGIRLAAEKDLAVIAPEMYKSYKSVTGNSESLPAEAATFNDLIKDMTPEQQKTAKLIKAGLKGRAITNAEMTAIQDGTIDSYGQWKTEQKQKEKFAEATGANRAKIIDQGFDKINKADVALRNIDKAVAALDKGAGVGAVEKLWPSITAASVELDNIRGQMALDVVGAVTFGALSEGELNLAKDVALPTGLDTNQLKDYLARKKAAQQKLRAYYYDQIQHLDQGGTVASFLRSKEREQQPTTGTQEVNQDEQALQWARANPNDPRAAAILQKLGAQ